MGVGGRGKCPGAPAHHLRRQRNKEIGMEKNGRPKGTVKSRMAKNGNGKKKRLFFTNLCFVVFRKKNTEDIIL
jgi:hypothetical protein